MPPKRRGAKRKRSESLVDRDAITTQREGRAVGHRKEDNKLVTISLGMPLLQSAREGKLAIGMETATPRKADMEKLSRGEAVPRGQGTPRQIVIVERTTLMQPEEMLEECCHPL